jgi:hypothetical protein
MWAQMTKMRLKTEKEQDIAGLFKHLLGQIQAYEQPGSGLLRTIAMQDQNDPSQFYVSSSSKVRRKPAPASSIRDANRGRNLHKQGGRRLSTVPWSSLI